MLVAELRSTVILSVYARGWLWDSRLSLRVG